MHQTSIRCGHAAAPCPSFPSDLRQPRPGSGGAYLTVLNETECRAAPLSAEDQLIQSMPGHQPGEVASRPYHLVLRAIPARRALRGLPALPPRLRLPVQFLLCQRRTPARPPPARPSDPPRRRGSHRLPPACRRRGGEILSRGRRGRAAGDRAAGRSRPQPRAAASGIDADRHPARLRAEPDSAGLRSGAGRFPASTPHRR